MVERNLVPRHETVPQNEPVFQLAGRILYVTKDPELIRKQIAGMDLPSVSPGELRDNISTDEIIPASVCIQYTGREEEEILGSHFLTGIPGDVIKPGDIQNGNFQVIVAGKSYGRGSSRMHAQIAHLEAGIQLVVADTERIFSENCANYGIYTLGPEDTIFEKLEEGEVISRKSLTETYSPLSKAIIESGGLLPFLRKFESGEEMYVPETTHPRPMTMTEKIIAKQVVNQRGGRGIKYVAPGQEYVVVPDAYYGYELQTTITRATLAREFGENVPVLQPEKLSLFDDHTALLPRSFQPAITQRREQKHFIIPLIPQGATLYESRENEGVSGICHTVMLEEKALPGQLILGNDSHTCTVGAVNALAVGKGAADLAGAIAFDKMVIAVPETIRFDLKGSLKPGVTTKDLMLTLLARPELKDELLGSGRVFEYGGEGLSSLSFDEQIKLTNMAIEGQGFTGILEPTNPLIKFMQTQHDLSREEVEKMLVFSDEDAEYAYRFEIDLSHVEPTIALPGDTQNGVPLHEVVAKHIAIQKAYIGSCTHGTLTDLEQAANILRGRKVAEGVKLYVQASSLKNLREARERGYINDLTDAGAELLPPGCGACMNAGPGSTEVGETGIFATNRNFPGRTGKGETYLASPAVVAASAVKGIICAPEDLEAR